jgi:CO/xanthine dehydrogenase Mo-binding subunit
MRLESDGSLRLLTGLMDVGEGSLTVMPQIAAEELGVGYGQVLVTFGDSETTPEAPLTAGSTATFSTGTATKEAARQLKARIIEVVAPLLDTEPSNLQITDDGVEHIQYPERSVSFAQIAESAGEIEVEAAISPGSRDHVINSFGAHFAEVEVDTDTGQVRVLRYIAAHDSGRILNPKLAINQVEGGVSQMLGFTLSEQMLTDPRNGVTLNASFLEHKSPTLQDFPEMQVLFADVVDPIGPFGAKALGEPPSIGVAPAVANAIYNAIGVRIRDLPLTPDRVLNEIEAQGGDSQ